MCRKARHLCRPGVVMHQHLGWHQTIKRHHKLLEWECLFAEVSTETTRSQDVWVVVPDKGKRRTHAGFSALVRAMHKRGQAAIVRYLSRDALSLCAASPLLGGDFGPDALVSCALTAPSCHRAQVADSTSTPSCKTASTACDAACSMRSC